MLRRCLHRSVGRPREFDEETALEAAMDAFWRNGYEATSLADLCTCTGLHKGSLYQAFGDKHQLFMRSLKHYADRTFSETAAVAFQSDSPLENIRAVMHKVVNDAAEDRGCLMINSLVELAPHDPEVKAALSKVGEQRLRLMTDLVTSAQRAGEIRSGQDPARLARQFMVTLAGVATTMKGFIGAEQAHEVIDDLLVSWA